ncbi:MAG: hypothetical protein J7M17_01000 [Anaerolineae bacterium]|nr:hypothetical protein [Anaerolineae bacterium]
MFTGFQRPQANWYRVPNTWFTIWQDIRQHNGRHRITSLLKATTYVIKHTWGRQNFDAPIRLSWHDFRHGVRRYGYRPDQGTGLSRGGLQQALTDAVALGLLERSSDPEYTYLPRLQPPDETPPPPVAPDATALWQGFTSPRSNFFKVPHVWTDLTATLSSAVTILTVEYFFRHTWGWATWDGSPRWLTADEIAHGRRYRSPERADERYDSGIGYSLRAVRDALQEAAARGLLVWRETETGRQYALHLQGMVVTAAGQFQEQPAEPVIPPVSPAAHGSEELTLRAQVRQLSRIIQALSTALAQAGIPIPAVADVPGPPAEAIRPLAEPNRPPTEPNRPPTELNRPPTEPNRPPTESNRPPYNKTPLLTPTPTPAPNNAAPEIAAGAVAETASETLPEDLCAALRQLDFRSRRSWRELRAAYRQDPQRIGGWVRRLLATRGQDPSAAGFLLQVVVRGDAPLPAAVQPATICPQCHGAGVVMAGDHAVPCPLCHPASTAP